MPVQESVVYDIANQLDVEDVVHLIAAMFSQADPLAVAMGLSFRNLEHFLQPFAPRTIADELTLVARSRDTRKLVGVLLTDDFAFPPAVDLKQVSAKFLPIFSILETLDEQFRKGTAISPGEYLHLFMLAVDHRFSGHGIGQGLLKACLGNGFRKGYRKALTEATGTVSQHVFRKQGFRGRFSVAYRDFMYEGKTVFASIQGHESAILMDRSLV